MFTATAKTILDLDSAASLLLRTFPHNRIFAFYGQMGAGKTTFIKALCRHLGVMDKTGSPTFSIVNEYLRSGDDLIYHFDFYRIKSDEEAFDIGYEEYFYSGNYCFVEWPERAENLLPPETIRVKITMNGTERQLSV